MNPLWVYAYYFPIKFLLTVTCMTAISIIYRKSLKAKLNKNKISEYQFWISWSLVNYSLLLMYITTYGRRSLNHYRFNYNVGYSYRAAFLNQNFESLKEILLNILIFIPLGILCGLAFKRFRLITSTLYGLALSAFIEYSQLFLRKGLFEYDDMISNTVGTVIGCVIAIFSCLIWWIIRKFDGDSV